MEGATAVTLASVLTDIGSVFTALTGWGGSVISFITANPLLLVGSLTGLAFGVIFGVKRLLP